MPVPSVASLNITFLPEMVKGLPYSRWMKQGISYDF